MLTPHVKPRLPHLIPDDLTLQLRGYTQIFRSSRTSCMYSSSITVRRLSSSSIFRRTVKLVPNHRTNITRTFVPMSLPKDIREFLDGYPRVLDDPSCDDNLQFYSNKRRCKPDNLLIDELHAQ